MEGKAGAVLEQGGVRGRAVDEYWLAVLGLLPGIAEILFLHAINTKILDQEAGARKVHQQARRPNGLHLSYEHSPIPALFSALRVPKVLDRLVLVVEEG